MTDQAAAFLNRPQISVHLVQVFQPVLKLRLVFTDAFDDRVERQPQPGFRFDAHLLEQDARLGHQCDVELFHHETLFQHDIQGVGTEFLRADHQLIQATTITREIEHGRVAQFEAMHLMEALISGVEQLFDAATLLVRKIELRAHPPNQ